MPINGKQQNICFQADEHLNTVYTALSYTYPEKFCTTSGEAQPKDGTKLFWGAIES